MLRVGIVGLPNVGKSSLFNALTAAGAPAENYPFCTVDPNVGTVPVPDPRLEEIRRLAGSRESVPTSIRFVDIAGLVRGASRGEGLGNQFLGQIREVDAIAHVVRYFQHPDVVHVMGTVDPLRDLEVVDTELALADLETVERRRERVEKKARSGEKEAAKELVLLVHLQEALEAGQPIRELVLSPEERAQARGLGLLTEKPVLLVVNVDDSALGAGSGDPPPESWLTQTRSRYEVLSVSLALEAELAILEPGERQEFLAALGIQETGSSHVIRAAFRLLDLITFFSTNDKQATAWAIPRGTKAPEAAGVIHSDFQRGFIRAEAIGYQEFVALGSFKAARERGAIRSEGKDYVVEDGDILLFRFNV
jgi:GTP-binding protein YchF